MKTSLCIKLFFYNATLALGVMGASLAQAQLGGVPLWTNRYSGPGKVDDHPVAMAVDTRGNVFVTGYSASTNVYPYNYDYATIAYSGAGVPWWTNRYNGPADSYDAANALAVDSSGKVLVTGTSQGGINATIAYSGAGVPLWTNLYNGSDNAMAVDGSGNVFVTGNSIGASGYSEYATIKYSSAGLPLWTNHYAGPGNGVGPTSAVAVDGGGNVFVAGGAYGSGGDFDYVTIKYSGTGVPLWTNRYNGPGNANDEATAVAVDGSGNVFVTGGSDSSGVSAYLDYATIAYSGAGVPLWTNRYQGPGNSYNQARAVAVDGSGNVFVTGRSSGSGSGFDYATIAYTGAGMPLWTNCYNGPGNLDDSASAVAVDGRGNVFVTGYASRTTTNNGQDDYTTLGYSGAGAPLWTNRYNAPGNYYAYAAAVAVDGSGNVFVTGSSWNGSSYEYATVKYSTAIPPSLTIIRTTTNTMGVSWPSPSTDFTLQQNANGIATVNWSNVVNLPADDGTTRTVIVDPGTGSQFYRLAHP